MNIEIKTQDASPCMTSGLEIEHAYSHKPSGAQSTKY